MRSSIPLLFALVLAGCIAPSAPVRQTPPPELAPAAAAPACDPEPAAAAIDPATADAIRRTALDYIEGWYDGDVERMTRALHPELAKRIVVTENGVSRLQHMTAAKLIDGVRAGYGKDTPADKRLEDVTILDVFENAASVKIVASDWIDYLHIAKFDGRWVIVNVLWERKPGA